MLILQKVVMPVMAIALILTLEKLHHLSLVITQKLSKKTWKQRSSLVGAGSDLPDELALYLRSPAEADTSKCPLSFWSSSTGTYPELSKIAKRYSASTTTSVPSERVFSQAGNIINPSRNRMKGETLSKLLFLHSLGEEYFF